MTTARNRSYVLSLTLTLLAASGCSRLTEPPREEPMSGSAQPKQAGGGGGGLDTDTDALGFKLTDKVKRDADGKIVLRDTPSEEGKLEMQDLVVGKGEEAKTGDNVSVHYVGTLKDGKEFDQSRKRGKPFEFKLGAGQVIKGWDQGVVGMKVGGKRKLTIPPSLGYGSRAMGDAIPANSTLVFEVELLEVKKP